MLLSENSQQWGSGHVAARKKEFGIWQEYTWQHHYQETKAICLGLKSLGFKPQDKAVILGRSCPEWLWCQLAVQTLRGEVLGPDPDEAPAATEKVVTSFRPRFAFGQDHEQVDRLLKIRQESTSIEKIVHWRVKDIDREDSALISLPDLRERGREYEKAHPAEFAERLGDSRSTDVAIVFAGAPEADPAGLTPVSYQFLLSSLSANRASAGNHGGQSTEYVVMAGLGQPLDQIVGVAASLVTGRVLNFPEIPATAQRDLREISPHVVALSAKAWNEMASTIESNARRGRWLKRGLLKLGLSVRLKLVDDARDHRSAGVLRRLAGAAAGFVVVQQLKDKHGLNRASTTFAVGNGLTPEAARLLKAIGVRLERPSWMSRDGMVGAEPAGDSGVY